MKKIWKKKNILNLIKEYMKLSTLDYVIYYIGVIITFGVLFVYKIVVKKALSEMNAKINIH